MLIEKSKVDILFLDDAPALHVLDVRSKNPQEVWDAFCNTRIGVLGQPESIQTGEGGELGNKVWTDLYS